MATESLPSSTAAWVVNDFDGFDSTTFNEHVPIPEIGEYDCLVKIEAASLNFRDLMIAKGTYPFTLEKGVVPGSDGAGIILATGSKVTRFQAGDRVYTITHLGYLAGDFDDAAALTSLGGSLDGTFRQHGIFPEWGLVTIPSTLSYHQAASLPGAGITAWNALYGLSSSHPLKPGTTVLTQGTGGLSIFAIQFALAAGALVIATTSSHEKAARLRALGVHHVINYRQDPNWGQTARNLTRDARGVDFVVEVGGPSTLEQSLVAVRRAGLIALCGAVGGSEMAGPALIRAWTTSCVMRGVAVGSRAHAEEMGAAIEAAGIVPVLDQRVFCLRDLKEGYRYLEEQRHFGKVVVDCWR